MALVLNVDTTAKVCWFTGSDSGSSGDAFGNQTMGWKLGGSATNQVQFEVSGIVNIDSGAIPDIHELRLADAEVYLVFIRGDGSSFTGITATGGGINYSSATPTAIAFFESQIGGTINPEGFGAEEAALSVVAGVWSSPSPWVHPVTNGDYKIIGFTTNNHDTQFDTDITNYDALVQANADTMPGFSALSISWKCLGSTATVDARDNIGGTFNYPLYNCNPTPDKVADSSTDLWDGSALDNPIEFLFDGITGPATWKSGSTTFGVASAAPFGNGGAVTEAGIANPGPTNWIDQGPILSTGRLCGVSETISTITGSLSGTIPRNSATVWAIGAITISGDIDFGGQTVDIKDALDGSQSPTYSGSGHIIDVGPGGSIEGNFNRSFTDTGANNTVTGNTLSGFGFKS